MLDKTVGDVSRHKVPVVLYLNWSRLQARGAGELDLLVSTLFISPLTSFTLWLVIFLSAMIILNYQASVTPVNSKLQQLGRKDLNIIQTGNSKRYRSFLIEIIILSWVFDYTKMSKIIETNVTVNVTIWSIDQCNCSNISVSLSSRLRPSDHRYRRWRRCPQPSFSSRSVCTYI